MLYLFCYQMQLFVLIISAQDEAYSPLPNCKGGGHFPFFSIFYHQLNFIKTSLRKLYLTPPPTIIVCPNIIEPKYNISFNFINFASISVLFHHWTDFAEHYVIRNKFLENKQLKMDPCKINIKNVKDYQMTVENSVKYDKKLINRTVFAKTYNEPILSNIQKKLILGPKINKNGKNRQNKNFTKNGVWSSLYPLMPFNFMQNIKKI